MKSISKIVLAIVLLLPVSVLAKHTVKDSKIQARFGETEVSLSGKSVQDIFYARGLSYLNKDEENDALSEFKGTFDTTVKVAYAPEEGNPRVIADLGARFKSVFGSKSKIKTESADLEVAGVDLTISGTSLKNHVLALRQGSLKVAIGTDQKIDKRYIQMGLFPFSVGRGISFGSAYNSGGFLAYDARFSIDQFAPGILFHSELFNKDVTIDLYYALLDNPHDSLSNNNAVIRADDLSFEYLTADNKTDINATRRGTGHRKWAAVTSLHWNPLNEEDHKLDINPYVVYHNAPDQSVEFTADANTVMWTAGLAFDFTYDRFSYGFETAINHGHSHIKPWDRNDIEFAADLNNGGVMKGRYTKIYTADVSDSANVIDDNLAYVDLANVAVVSSTEAVRGFSQNSVQISAGPDLWNAPDRFRPAQNKLFEGWFFIADAAYECIEDRLTVAVDAGYVSGALDKYDDVNSLTETQRLNQKFGGFVPLQSVYSGKRVNHAVVLNQGVPRFGVDDPTKDIKNLYTTSKVNTDSTNGFTNLMYVGGAVELSFKYFDEREASIKPTVIHYWTPASPNDANGKEVSSSLGTSLSIEAETHAWENLSVEGFFGVMFPGRQYEQLKGVKIGKGTLGNDISFVTGFTVGYKF